MNTLHKSSDAQDSLSISLEISSRTVGRKSRFVTSHASQGPTTANVLQEYLSRKETALKRNQSDPMIDFFINMAKTVITFPIQDKFALRHNCFKWLIA